MEQLRGRDHNTLTPKQKTILEQEEVQDLLHYPHC